MERETNSVRYGASSEQLKGVGWKCVNTRHEQLVL